MNYNFLLTATSNEPEALLWAKYAAGDTKAGDAIVALYAKYILKVAHTFAAKFPEISFDCLLAEGLSALAEKMEDYADKQVGCPFIQFARVRIKGSMLDYIREEHRNGLIFTPESEEIAKDAEGNSLTIEDTYTDYRDPLSQCLFDEQEALLKKYKNELPEPMKTVVNLHINGYTYEKIGEYLDQPKANIQYYWNKALAILKEKMKNA